jgi:hypothetical protein
MPPTQRSNSRLVVPPLGFGPVRRSPTENDPSAWLPYGSVAIDAWYLWSVTLTLAIVIPGVAFEMVIDVGKGVPATVGAKQSVLPSTGSTLPGAFVHAKLSSSVTDAPAPPVQVTWFGPGELLVQVTCALATSVKAPSAKQTPIPAENTLIL